MSEQTKKPRPPGPRPPKDQAFDELRKNLAAQREEQDRRRMELPLDEVLSENPEDLIRRFKQQSGQ